MVATAISRESQSLTHTDGHKKHNVLHSPNVDVDDTGRTHEFICDALPIVIVAYNLPEGATITAEFVDASGLAAPLNIGDFVWVIKGGMHSVNVIPLPGTFRLVIPAAARGIVTVTHYQAAYTLPISSVVAQYYRADRACH